MYSKEVIIELFIWGVCSGIIMLGIYAGIMALRRVLW